MAKITISITRDDTTKEWLLFDKPGSLQKYFSEQEISDIIVPYRNLVESLPGFVDYEVIFVSEYNMNLNTIFDTLENARSASLILSNQEKDTIQGKYKKLISDLRSKLNLNYTFSASIVE